jgi:TolB protein
MAGDRTAAVVKDSIDVAGYSLAWSRDSRKLAFPCRIGAALCIVSVDGTGYQRLSAPKGVRLSGAEWAPTGNLMAFADDGIYIGKPDGSRLRIVTSGGTDRGLSLVPAYSQPAWSPDGRKIAFARRLTRTIGGLRVDSLGLYVVNADGTGLRKLSLPDGSVDSPDWSPDGRHIVFRRLWPPECGFHCHSDFYVVNADGSHPLELTHKDHADLPAWSPFLAH